MVKFNFNSSLATVIAVVPTVCSMAQEKPMNVILLRLQAEIKKK